MNLEDYRAEIDKIDQQFVSLLEQRMEIAAKIADYKKQNNLPILDTERERKVSDKVATSLKPEMAESGRILYDLLFELSRSYQNRISNKHSELYKEISNAIENTPSLFPTEAVVACQGVEGAYSQLACTRIFRHPNIMYFDNFEGVFSAIENGFCKYGILPLENSSAGSVNKVYQLMMKHNFKIVRSTRIKVEHHLVAKKGTKFEDIKEIVSHEHALNQCTEFLSSLKGIKLTTCKNTAMAAMMVSVSERNDIAALSSQDCLDLYGLDCLKAAVQDRDNNYTRFICITKELEIYPGADKTSLMMILNHHPGALYQVLSRFYSLGMNLIKLESRPLPNREFEFMFYFDLETSIYSNEYVQLMDTLNNMCREFKYLGSYCEVI